MKGGGLSTRRHGTIYTCIYICKCTYIGVCIHLQTSTYTHTHYNHMNIYIYIYTCIFSSTYVLICMCLHMHMYIYIYIERYIYRERERASEPRTFLKLQSLSFHSRRDPRQLLTGTPRPCLKLGCGLECPSSC